MKRRGVGILAAVAVSVAITTTALADQINVTGGGAAVTGFFMPCMKSYEEETGHKMVTTQTSPAAALIAVEQGRADIATVAMPFSKIVQDAKKLNFNIDTTNYEQTLVGVNNTVVMVSKQNKIQKLTREQLKDIFTGKVTNWKEVGGDDVPIEVVWGTQTMEQNGIFSEQVLDSSPVTKKAIQATDYIDIRLQVSRRPGGIGIAPAGYVVGMIRVVRDTPKIYADVIAITKRKSAPAVYDLLLYVRKLLVQMDRD